MTHEQADLRIRRTQKLLQEALIDLIAERGFESITVGDIAERAMVNRATFYRHFQDKYDLVSKLFEEAADRLNRDLGPPQRLSHSISLENPPEPWVKVFEHFANYERFYRTMLVKNGSSWFVTRMRNYLIRVVEERGQLFERPLGVKLAPHLVNMPREIAIAFISSSFLSIVTWWLEHEMPYSPKQMTAWFLHFVLQGYVDECSFETPASFEER